MSRRHPRRWTRMPHWHPEFPNMPLDQMLESETRRAAADRSLPEELRSALNVRLACQAIQRLRSVEDLWREP